jgi:serine/threonine-protein kinase
VTTPVGRRNIDGSYVLGEALGRGGTAQVFRARHLTDPQELAAKRIPLRDADDERALLAHYAHIARLQHRHILPILDVRIGDGCLYVISPLAAGGSLRERLRRSHLEPRQALPLIRQIADALHYVHAQHCLHLDIKPGNILLAAEDTPVVSDFGLPPRHPGSTGRALVRGTPAYMAPEQCTSGQLSPATDQYALGVISFELLTGFRPFSGSAPDDLLRRQVSEPPPSPTSLHPGLPREIDTVVLKALHKDPRQRYPDTVAFAVALERALASAASLTAPSGDRADPDHTLDVATLELDRSALRPRM